MAVFFGVVKGNRVELEGNARLKDGARVEVRPVAPEGTGVDTADVVDIERVLMQDLLASGLLDQDQLDEAAPEEPFEPVTVQGRPLSEQIIEERR